MQRLASWGFSIPAAGNHKEHVWKLLEYLVSAEVAASIYRNLGWLGGLHRDLPLHIDVTENPILVWYIESLDKADRIYGVKANPYLRTASSLWSEVYDKVMRGEGLARPLLEDANRTLNALIAEGQASL